MIVFVAAGLMAGGPVVDADYPGGNIIVERQEGDIFELRQDRRDTEGWWFYWNFRVRGAAGRELTFRFTDQNPLGTRGPAVSTDGGLTWRWLGPQAGPAFRYAFAPGEDDVRFAFCIPYLEADLRRFLAAHAGESQLVVEELCRTAGGRSAELLRVGRLDGAAPLKILLTARHHACEAMASYVLEGLLAAILTGDDGAWWRERVEVLAVPFVDKDGVEAGDQGKNRRPRDHNRDYLGESVHETVRAVRETIPARVGDGLAVALDFHCPYIRGQYNEHPYFVGPDNPAVAAELARFSEILEAVNRSGVPYRAAGNLPFGQAWNTGANFAGGRSFSAWARELPGVKLAATLEFPYANVGQQTLSAADARAFGAALTTALRRYLTD